MSLKYSITTADYMQWDEMTNLVRRLLHDKDYKIKGVGTVFALSY